MKKTIYIFITLILLSNNLFSGPLLLLDSFSSKSMGLGDSTVSCNGDIEFFTVNPAAIGKISVYSVSAFYLLWFADMHFFSFNTGFPVHIREKHVGTFGVNFSFFSMKPFANYSRYGQRLQDLKSNDYLFTTGYGHSFSKVLDWGFNLKLINTKLSGKTSTSFAMDFGIILRIPIPALGIKNLDSFKLGFSMQNLIFSKRILHESNQLPLKIRTGMSYALLNTKKFNITILSDINITIHQTFKWSAGLDLTLWKILKLRLGGKLRKNLMHIYGGMGFCYNIRENKLYIDYAILPMLEMKNQINHAFSLKMEFGNKRNRRKKTPKKAAPNK